MQKPDAVAKVAAFVVVLSGSAGVGLSCASRSFELLTAAQLCMRWPLSALRQDPSDFQRAKELATVSFFVRWC